MEHRDLLRDVRIAKPCPMKWAEMRGNDRVRYCGKCELNVFNLSNMTRDEAVDLLQDANGRICTRFFRRADGMMMTADCRRSTRAAIAAARWPVGAVGLFLIAAFGAAIGRPAKEEDYYESPVIETMRSWPVFGPIVEKVWPQRMVMGSVAVFSIPYSPHVAYGPSSTVSWKLVETESE